jgi:hypothetical protein
MILNFPMPNDAQIFKAVDTYLIGPVGVSAKPWHSIVALILRGLSYSDIERELLRIRREAVVRNQPIEIGLQEVVKSRLISLPTQDRKKVAIDLMELGFSQRQTHEWTGVSRDTIRKAQRVERARV